MNFCFDVIVSYFVLLLKKIQFFSWGYPFWVLSIQIISCVISLVCLSKYPYSCFYSYFCFLDFVILLFLRKLFHLILLLLVVVIHFSLHFFVYSPKLKNIASMPASHRPSPFLDTLSLVNIISLDVSPCTSFALSTGAIEYTDCFSAER